MRWPHHPAIYEINTWVWIGELSARYGRSVDLGSVPAAEWDEVCRPGIDAVWLMGVWSRSPVAAAIFRADAAAVDGYRRLLPDYDDRDVVGSAYAVRAYTADPDLGGDDGLAVARSELARRGCALVLDYVPNHTAPDHPWLLEAPERYIRATPADLAADPGAFLAVNGAVDGTVVARGRDPYFPPWPDVAQLDLFAAEARRAAIDTLRAIGDRADAVRCDMAMLAVTDVFARTWGDRAAHPPSGEFWDQVIGEVRTTHPALVFLAEAYWGMEGALVEQGFDACYDKELYDHLVAADPGATRARVRADHANRSPWVRFVENHDEPRAATAFAPGADRAAATVIATLPGTTLWHEGQFDGRQQHVPVILGRRPEETPDIERRAFYARLLPAARAIRRGDWRMAATSGWADNPTHDHLLAWTWSSPSARSLVVVNLAAEPAQGHVHPPWPDLAASTMLTDALTGVSYERDGATLARDGLYVELPAWGVHLFTVS